MTGRLTPYEGSFGTVWPDEKTFYFQMVRSVNSTLIRPNLEILNFLSNNNDLHTMLTIHCKLLILLTFSYTRIFSIYNNNKMWWHCCYQHIVAPFPCMSASFVLLSTAVPMTRHLELRNVELQPSLCTLSRILYAWDQLPIHSFSNSAQSLLACNPRCSHYYPAPPLVPIMIQTSNRL